MDEKVMREIVSLLKPNRPVADTVASLKDAEKRFDISLSELIKELCPDGKCDESKATYVDLWLNADEDSPVEFRKLSIQGDHNDISTVIGRPGLTLVRIENWLRTFCYHIRCQEPFWIYRNGGRYIICKVMFFNGGAFNEWSYMSILNRLESKECFKPNIFSSTGFWTTIGNKDGMFNLFTGFMRPVSYPLDDKNMRILIDILSRAAGSDKGLQYILNWLAHIVQKPGEQIGTIIVFPNRPEIITWIGTNVFGSLYDEVYCVTNMSPKLLTCFTTTYSGEQKKKLLAPTIKYTVCDNKMEMENHQNFIIRCNNKAKLQLPFVVMNGTDLQIRTHDYLNDNCPAKFMSLLRARDISEWDPMDWENV